MILRAKLTMPCAAVAAALLLAACGGSSKSLIPSGDAGPLQRDFEAVAAAAAKGDGDCKKTNAAIAKMNRHFDALPGSIDVGLREKLEEGIENLSAKAIALCEQPSASTTTTQTTEVITTTTHTTTTESEITPTETVETETLSTSSSGGGTEAPTEVPSEESEEGESGGTGAEAPTETPSPPGGAAPGGGVGAP
jgi:hypothetical protein